MVWEKLKSKKLLFIFEVVVFLLVINFAVFLNKSNRQEIWEFDESDIQFEIFSARQLSSGENPYSKILKGNLLINDKYPTLFPLYYQYLALLDNIGGNYFENTIDMHRQVIFASQVIGAIAIYLIFRREKRYFVGALAAAFFVFNKWTLANVMDAKQDIIAIAALMIALYFFTSKNKKGLYAAAFFYGISMGIKHLGIFVSPIFLIPIIYKKINFRETLVYALLFLVPTIFISLPIILDSPDGFFYSIMFSFTRIPTYKDGKYVYDSLVLYNVGVENNNIFYYMLPRIPLVIFIGLNSILVLMKKIPIFVYCLASIFIFVALNPTLIDQYFTWITPFVFLTMLENKVFTS